jgi:hypothetical protein
LPFNFSGFVDEDDAIMNRNQKELAETDNTTRLIIGAVFGVVFGVLLVIFLVTRVFRRRRYRVVRRWNPDDVDDRRFVLGNDFPQDLDADTEMDSMDTNHQSKTLLRGS